MNQVMCNQPLRVVPGLEPQLELSAAALAAVAASRLSLTQPVQLPKQQLQANGQLPLGQFAQQQLLATQSAAARKQQQQQEQQQQGGFVGSQSQDQRQTRYQQQQPPQPMNVEQSLGLLFTAPQIASRSGSAADAAIWAQTELPQLPESEAIQGSTAPPLPEEAPPLPPDELPPLPLDAPPPPPPPPPPLPVEDDDMDFEGSPFDFAPPLPPG